MALPPTYAVILAGGSGTRFWPASRRKRPKQVLPVVGGETLIAATRARLGDLVPPERVLVVTAVDQAEQVAEALPGLPPANLLAEPEPRNTAAAVAWAAAEIERREPGAIQVVLPADHEIRPAESFRSSLAAAIESAAGETALFTFGVRPSRPATGFGYIETGEVVREAQGVAVHDVLRFVEKPDAARAREYLESGRFLWNSGMFVWSCEAIGEALRRHLPEAHEALFGPRAPSSLAEAYARIPALSVDVAVLEKAESVRVLPIDYFWSDVGAWPALLEVLESDARGNVVAGGGRVVEDDASGCVVWGEEGSLTALIGVQDLIVVRTADATLVCPRERAQEVRDLVERLRGEAWGEEYL